MVDLMDMKAMKQVFSAIQRVRIRADKDMERIEVAEAAQEIEAGLVGADVPAASGQGTNQARVVGRLAESVMEVDERALVIPAPAQQFRKSYARGDIGRVSGKGVVGQFFQALEEGGRRLWSGLSVGFGSLGHGRQTGGAAGWPNRASLEVTSSQLTLARSRRRLAVWRAIFSSTVLSCC